MLINHEVPISCLGQDWFNDYGYALAHNFNDRAYVEHFKSLVDKGIDVYLDNSAFELGESVKEDHLIDCLDALGGNAWLFLPDKVKDSEETLRRSSQLAKVVHGPKWGVIQGETNDELDYCLKEMLKLTHLVALPYRVMDRKEFIERNRELLTNAQCSIHLLGVGDIRELAALASEPLVRSVDTSLPVVTGIHGTKLGLDTPKDTTPVWGFTTTELPDLVYRNTTFFRSVTKGMI